MLLAKRLLQGGNLGNDILYDVLSVLFETKSILFTRIWLVDASFVSSNSIPPLYFLMLLDPFECVRIT